jgi:hypothetical protein
MICRCRIGMKRGGQPESPTLRSMRSRQAVVVPALAWARQRMPGDRQVMLARQLLDGGGIVRPFTLDVVQQSLQLVPVQPPESRPAGPAAARLCPAPSKSAWRFANPAGAGVPRPASCSPTRRAFKAKLLAMVKSHVENLARARWWHALRYSEGRGDWAAHALRSTSERATRFIHGWRGRPP